MKFFNKKEQVIDLQITQYGKHLLSKGAFKPVYYAFYDDGILYDAEYGGITGSQGSIQERITDLTPQLQTQYVYRGIEPKIKRLNTFIRTNAEYESIYKQLLIAPPELQPMGDREYGLQNEIGNSDLNSQFAPAWSIKFLEGAITSSATTISGTSGVRYIPQLNASDIVYKTSIQQYPPSQIEDSLGVFKDNTYINVSIENGSILLEIDENNVFYGENNFEIEVYEVENDQVVTEPLGIVTQEENLNLLYFTKKEEYIKNNILMDRTFDESLSDEDAFEGLDPSYVEYYLKIEIDEEISSNILCDKTLDRTQGIFSTKMLDCSDAEKRKKINAGNIFNTDVDIEDLEGCE